MGFTVVFLRSAQYRFMRWDTAFRAAADIRRERCVAVFTERSISDVRRIAVTTARMSLAIGCWRIPDLDREDRENRSFELVMEELVRSLSLPAGPLRWGPIVLNVLAMKAPAVVRPRWCGRF